MYDKSRKEERTGRNFGACIDGACKPHSTFCRDDDGMGVLRVLQCLRGRPSIVLEVCSHVFALATSAYMYLPVVLACTSAWHVSLLPLARFILFLEHAAPV
jgi:hypothetical protein